MALHYTNRRGRTYYLHRRKTKKGKVRYVFAKSVSDGALDALPDGYQVRESINGVVSVVSLGQARLITELEEQAVRSAMAELDLHEYRLEVRGNAITIFEPDRRVADLAEPFEGISPFGLSKRAVDNLARRVNYSPVLRFVLDDRSARTFHVERMTYRGAGGWSYPLRHGKIASLAKTYVPHVGKNSMFELF